MLNSTHPTPTPAQQVKEYDAISRIDAWLTAQLLHIKKNIDSDETIN